MILCKCKFCKLSITTPRKDWFCENAGINKMLCYLHHLWRAVEWWRNLNRNEHQQQLRWSPTDKTSKLTSSLPSCLSTPLLLFCFSCFLFSYYDSCLWFAGSDSSKQTIGHVCLACGLLIWTVMQVGLLKMFLVVTELLLLILRLS